MVFGRSLTWEATLKTLAVCLLEDKQMQRESFRDINGPLCLFEGACPFFDGFKRETKWTPTIFWVPLFVDTPK